MSPLPPFTQLLLTTLYIYFVENWGAFFLIIKKTPLSSMIVGCLKMAN